MIKFKFYNYAEPKLTIQLARQAVFKETGNRTLLNEIATPATTTSVASSTSLDECCYYYILLVKRSAFHKSKHLFKFIVYLYMCHMRATLEL